MLKIIKLLATVLVGVFLPFSAMSEPVDPQTRAGFAQVETASNGVAYLRIGAQNVQLPDAPRYAFIEARRGDLLLIALSQGGNACPATYVWIHAVPGAIQRSAVFGTCADVVTVTHDGEAVHVSMSSMQAGQGNVVFSYDGNGTITEHQFGLAQSGMGAGDGPEFWIGKHPYDLISAADYQAAFVALMGQGALDQAYVLLSVANNMERDGDWVVGRGCAPHDCTDTAGAVAVHLKDGRLLVALWRKGEAARLWGNPGGVTPGEIAHVLGRR